MENGKFPGIEAEGAGAATVLTVASCCVGADYTTDNSFLLSDLLLSSQIFAAKSLLEIYDVQEYMRLNIE